MKKTLPASHALVPDNAQRVFNGQIFDVYQWPQKLFNGSDATFEMLRRPDTVQVIAVKGSQILLVKDEQPARTPRIHFPGGRADQDASWEQAAQRELREETGLVCKTWKLLDVQQPIIKIEWFTPIFLATDITDTLEQALDAGEKITTMWQEFSEVRDQVLSTNEQMMQYLVPFFTRTTTLEALLTLPTFTGKDIDR
jgi:ADP-ribose pyrophosphatase